MAYTADVNRWRGPDSEAYRPRIHVHPGMVIGTILGFPAERRPSGPNDQPEPKPAGPWGSPK